MVLLLSACWLYPGFVKGASIAAGRQRYGRAMTAGQSRRSEAERFGRARAEVDRVDGILFPPDLV